MLCFLIRLSSNGAQAGGQLRFVSLLLSMPCVFLVLDELESHIHG